MDTKLSRCRCRAGRAVPVSAGAGVPCAGAGVPCAGAGAGVPVSSAGVGPHFLNSADGRPEEVALDLPSRIP